MPPARIKTPPTGRTSQLVRDRRSRKTNSRTGLGYLNCSFIFGILRNKIGNNPINSSKSISTKTSKDKTVFKTNQVDMSIKNIRTGTMKMLTSLAQDFSLRIPMPVHSKNSVGRKNNASIKRQPHQNRPIYSHCYNGFQ